MKKTLLSLGFALLAVSHVRAADADSRPFVSPVFGDHMVLQRGRPNSIWGWAAPGSEVRVSVGDHQATALASADGRWQVRVDPPPMGGPYVLQIDGPESVTLTDVMVGDVWLCGGQSNMFFGLMEARDGAEEVAAANHPGIRLYRVAQQASYDTAATVEGSWQVCAPAAFKGWPGFSAVAYYFGRKVHEATGVPIGLIEDCVGGTPAETWMNPATLRAMPEFSAALAEIDRLKARGGPEYGNYIMHWYDEYDRGLEGDTWGAVDFDDSSWKTVTIPGAFADLGVPDTPAVAWFRREIELPDPLPAGQARIQLGVVEKMDTTEINGRWVGASSWVENPRNYAIPDGVLHPGSNLVTIRVLKLKPDGGFQSPADQLRIVLGDGSTIPLAGTWKGAVSVDARPPHPLPLGYENYPTMPSVLYQGMIAPVAPLALTGAIWYQGEANQFHPLQYRKLLPAMIGDWRAAFGQGDFPFYIVSLPAFMERRAEPGVDGWTLVREAQAYAAETVPNCGLAVTVDTGEADNIHPTEKLPVGERLALLALNRTYGRDVVCEGPAFAGIEQRPGELRVTFTHTDGGLVVKGDRLGEFSVAGADQVWHWADAHIDGDTVIVSSSEVPEPVAVRYAWQANPLATLYNGAGLPAVPFRSDDWKENP